MAKAKEFKVSKENTLVIDEFIDLRRDKGKSENTLYADKYVLEKLGLLICVGLSGCNEQLSMENETEYLTVEVYCGYQVSACMRIIIDDKVVAPRFSMSPYSHKTFKVYDLEKNQAHTVAVGAGMYVPEYNVCSTTAITETKIIEGDISIDMGYYGDITISKLS